MCLYYNQSENSKMNPAPKKQTGPISKSSSNLSLGPIRYRRMADQVAAAIRESIAHRKLAPGTHLFEVEIAREMQTSRVPVREALIQLEQEGLVVRQANRGTFVAEFTEKVVREVSTLRGVLEGYAVSQAVKRISSEALTQLERLVAEMGTAATHGDFSTIQQCDYEFHRCIVNAANHELLEEVWRLTDAKVRVYLSATNLMHPDLKSIAASHALVLEAIRSHDPERARKALIKHIDEALALLLKRLVLSPHT
jgi:DNA-binding GntR family transcriptional regulator